MVIITTFIIISRSVLRRMKNVSDKRCTESFVYSVTLFENRTVYEIMWKNIAESDRSQMTIWCMRMACCIPKATDTHSEYVTLIAFSLQQRLHEPASVLRYTRTYVACLVITETVCVCCCKGILKRSLAGKWLDLLTQQTWNLMLGV
jgi:hypothetical protein